MKLVSESLNENMRYKDFFGKEISHNEALQKFFRDTLVNIIVDERGISEKSFSMYDDVINEVKVLCDNNPYIYEMANKFYNQKRRINLLAEQIYDKYFSQIDKSE
jgi:hypothetical protein